MQAELEVEPARPRVRADAGLSVDVDEQFVQVGGLPAALVPLVGGVRVGQGAEACKKVTGYASSTTAASGQRLESCDSVEDAF